MTQQAGPIVTKIVVAVALTNILACMLANILVATRLTYSMARDNMLPFSHVWRHVSPSNRTPTYAVLGTVRPVHPPAAVGAGQPGGVLPHHRDRLAAVFASTSCRRCPAHRPTAAAPSRAASPARSTWARARVPVAVLALRGVHPGVRGPDLPAAVRGQRLGVPRYRGARRALVGHRAAWPAGRGEAGPDFARTHLVLKYSSKGLNSP